MKKLWQALSNNFLKAWVCFLILFIPLYPKLPTVHIIRTWVYVRLEDFFIAIAVLLWLFLFVRKKIKLPMPLAIPFGLYWISALGSLLVAIFLIGPTIINGNFFPHVAALQFLRRVEYMVLFFIALSTIRSKKDLQAYVITIIIAVLGVILYGLGQRNYLVFWEKFPQFFQKYPFCFPSFQTGNEEFAKGIPLCLPPDARITSTFGGHYDLAAYMVFVIPILVAALVTLRRWSAKIGLAILSVLSLVMLLFTASRVSYIAYLVGVICMLIFMKQKKYLLPVLIISIGLLLFFSGSTAKRFLDTIRITSIVTNNQGQIVGETVSSLPENLQKKISKNPVVVEAPPPTQNLPTGSTFITLPQAHTPISTSAAVVRSGLSEKDALRLKLKYGGEQLATVSGSFLIQKALVYDISFTTRFQAEWPNAWNAFLRDPPLGSGFSTITLATDGDYLRFLGESGFLGLLSFLSIFLLLGITVYVIRKETEHDRITYAYIYGIIGGVIGLLVNALFIDVFESSKVAESMWIFLGIAAGSLLLYKKQLIDYRKYLREVFLSHTFISLYLLLLVLIVFLPSINNFFVANDFILLKNAASSTLNMFSHDFKDTGMFHYGPLSRAILFVLYTIFSFQPVGYHLFIIVLHYLAVIAVYRFIHFSLKNKLLAALAAGMFALLPFNGNTLFWISNISAVLASVFVMYGTFLLEKYLHTKKFVFLILSTLLYIGAFLSNSFSVVFMAFVVVVRLCIYIYIEKMKRQDTLINKIYVEIILFLTILFYAGVFQTIKLDEILHGFSYLINIFFIVLFAMLLYRIWMKKLINRRLITSLVTIYIVIFTMIYYGEIQDQKKDWEQAGEITKDTLTYFRVDEDSIPQYSNLYFVDTPTKINKVPVYPVGLTEGLWFIYRDPTLHVHQVKTLDEAKQLKINAEGKSLVKNFIFGFNSNKEVYEIK